MNNSMWVLSEMKTWLNSSITEVQKLKQNTSISEESSRLKEKESTLRMVYSKLLQLENE